MLTLSVPINLPTWLIYAGVIGSIIITLVHIVVIVKKILLGPTLEVRLTRETFFRLSNLGESIFNNAVLIARNDSIEIRNVEFELTKNSSASKKYQVKPIYFGEKVRGSNNLANQEFQTTSPLQFIPENQPLRVVYLSAIDDYQEKIKEEFYKFENSLFELRNEMETKIAGSQDPEDIKTEAIQRASEILKKSLSDVFDLVQLEEGIYNVKIKIMYRSARTYIFNDIFNKIKTKESEISFTVGPTFRAFYKNLLDEYLKGTARNILLNETGVHTFPEYPPTNIKEV